MNKVISYLMESDVGVKLYSDYVSLPNSLDFAAFLELPIDLQLFSINCTLSLHFGVVLMMVEYNECNNIVLMRKMIKLPFDDNVIEHRAITFMPIDESTNLEDTLLIILEIELPKLIQLDKGIE